MIQYLIPITNNQFVSLHMISIDNVLISDEVTEEHFVCDLVKCKGGCCVDGDAGAPLEDNELKELNDAYQFVAPYLTDEVNNCY